MGLMVVDVFLFIYLGDDDVGSGGGDGAFAISFCFIHHVTSSATSCSLLLLTWMRLCRL